MSATDSTQGKDAVAHRLIELMDTNDSLVEEFTALINASNRYFSLEHERFTRDGAEIMGTNIYRRLILPHNEAQRRAGNKVHPEL